MCCDCGHDWPADDRPREKLLEHGAQALTDAELLAIFLRIGVAGLGTVGASVLRILRRQENALAARCGRAIRVVAVSARDRTRDRGVDLGGFAWYDDPVAMVADPNVDVVIELIGGASGAAETLVRAALAAGKPVITAN